MIKLNNGDYFGQIKEGKKHGVGVYIAENGNIYEGITLITQEIGDKI